MVTTIALTASLSDAGAKDRHGMDGFSVLVHITSGLSLKRTMVSAHGHLIVAFGWATDTDAGDANASEKKV